MASPLLRNASLLYLGLPWLVFAVGWLRPAAAASVIGLLLLTAGVEIVGASSHRNRSAQVPLPESSPSGRGIPFLSFVFIVLLAAVWTALSGAGGWGFQNLDWHKHNLLLSDLTEERWPVDYTVLQQTGSSAVPLTYYLAYYLPAAALGRGLGWAAANNALYAYTVAGALLALLWFAALTRRRLLCSSLLFPVLSGLDVIGRIVWSGGYRPTAHLEWWAGMGSYQYSSNTSLLFWVPQHALAGWILTGLIVQGARDERCARFALFALALGMLWSPFVTLGLAPFALAAACVSGRRGASFANLVAAPALALVALLFLASRSGSPPHGWWFEEAGAAAEWPKLAGFYVLELGVFAALCPPGRWRDRLWWWIAVALLLVLPLYRIGRFNDLTMRASIPALFVLWSSVAAALQDRAPATRRLVLAALISIGAVTPANEVMRALSRYQWAIPEVDERPLMAQDPLYRFYLGDADSWFFRHLARPLRQVITVEAEHPRRTERAIRSEPSEAASDGRVLVLGDTEVALAYGFELEHPIRAATLIARYRSPHATSFEVSIDGTSEGELSLTLSSGEWRFASTRLSGDLGAGWHELDVRGSATRSEIDVFVLVEAGR